ncbi:MAG: hypothetical protein QOH25_610 [Acidobacteriota bacterium]|nr:hypothetical protein [Acidobacteriota bacterium]
MEYTVLKETTLERLMITVSQYINNGWRPQGGVAIDGYTNYYQAMVKD